MFKLFLDVSKNRNAKKTVLAMDYALFYILPFKFRPTFQTPYVEYAYQILDTGCTGCHVRENQHLNLLLIFTV